LVIFYDPKKTDMLVAAFTRKGDVHLRRKKYPEKVSDQIWRLSSHKWYRYHDLLN